MLKLRWSVSALAVLLIVIFGATSAQTAQTDSAPAGTDQGPDAYNHGSWQTPVLQRRHPRYHVLPSDVLTVSFPLSPEINDVVTVTPDGYITLYNVGSLYVEGQTVPQIVDTLKVAYARILHNPIIEVDLTNFHRPQFTVSGQVGKPGQYELRSETTVFEAIAIAGGFLPTAKTQVFLYHRVSPSWVEVKKLNLKQILRGKNVNEDVHLQSGDMVFVPEKFIVNFKKYVPYNYGLYLNPSSAFF